MSHLRTTLLLILLAWATPAQAYEWVTYDAKGYGFKMLVPKGTKIVDKESPQGWACLWGKHEETTAFGYAHLGRHHTRKEIEDYGVARTGIPCSKWKEIDKGKTHGFWTWYRTVVATKNDILYVGTYGIGPRGSYLLLLKTTPEDYAADTATYKTWYQGLDLYGGWKIYRAKSYGFSMLIPDGSKLNEREAGGWGELYLTHKGVELQGSAKKGVHLDMGGIEAYGVRATGIPSDNWVETKSEKNTRGWRWVKTVKAKQGNRLSIGVYGHGPKGTYVLVIKTTQADYRRHKRLYDLWYKGIFLD